ncbi:unnamed protein product, partial [Effrenium voratum]
GPDTARGQESKAKKEAKETKAKAKPKPKPKAKAAASNGELSPDEQWERRRDQMILPAAKVVSHDGKQGSAVVLAQKEGTYVLTCHHVIRDCIKQIDRWDPVEKSSKKVEQFMHPSVETFLYDPHGRHLQTVVTSADIVAYRQYGDQWSFEGDLALLKLKAPVDIPACALIGEEDFDEVRPLDEVVMVGCPDASEVPLPTLGHVASLSEQRAGIGLMLSQVFGNPGSSGSAVFRFSPERQRYEVIALHSLTDSRGSLTNVGRGNFLRLAVRAPEIHKFLRLHSFGHLVAEPSEGNTSQAEVNGTKTAKAKAKSSR